MSDSLSDGLTIHAVGLPTGVTLNVVARPGEGTPVICLHGIWDDWRYFLPLVEDGPGSFRGRPLYLVDHRGHGDSSKPESGYGWQDYVGDLLALVDYLQADRVTLAGHSLGAITCLLAAAEIPGQVESMLLEDPPVPMNRENATVFLGLLDLKQRPFDAIVEEFMLWRPWISRVDAEASARRLTATADGVLRESGEGALGQTTIPTPGVVVNAPTLVIQAGIPEQRAFHDPGRDLLATVLPNMQVVTIPDTSHNVLRERPDAYRDVLAGFFDAPTS